MQSGMFCLCFAGLFLFNCAALDAQPARGATLSGAVILEDSNRPLHHATVSIPRLRRSVESGDDGRYELRDLPAGTYDVIAHMHGMADQRKTVKIEPGAAATADFGLRLSVIHEQVTVTASGAEQVAADAFQAVTAVDTLELATKAASSLGDVLENQSGVAKRSFGPGTTRPVIRGFDGDRVLVLQDGIRTGTVSSQSGDHGEPIDPASVSQVEVVKGPAALLYGSNAIGGVVNIITSHHQLHAHPHEGARGYITANGGSNNAYGAGSGGFEYGAGRWLISGDGGAQRTGDYSSPLGRVDNSHTRMETATAGFGHYGDTFIISANYGVQDGRYGVPFTHELLAEEEGDGADEHAGDVDLAFRRQNVRLNMGSRFTRGGIERFNLTVNYSDWTHKELEGSEIGTQFFNKQFIYKGMFEQRTNGRFSGRFGISGMVRDYNARGVESLSPPVDQGSFAAFGLEEIGVGRARLQVGGRVEHTRYNAEGARYRTFTGASAAAGLNVQLWAGGGIAANFTHSFRAPALEELYNFGPHIGNLSFEIGDTDLKRELADGIDLAVRHRARRVFAEANLFYYSLGDFVYLAPTGEIRDGLIESRYSQADSRFLGAEARLDIALREDLWLNLGFDAVDAELKQSGTPLPRIPPARGRVGLDYHHRSFTVRPQLVIANQQQQIFPTETRTAGYALVNLEASYNRASQHALHVIAVSLFNAGDRLYRNHLSLIKEFAPEIGRGVRLTYTVRFF